MENASKALIIAAAILIAIVLISLGVYVIGIGQDQIKNGGMSDIEISAFNQKFTKYQGTQKGSTIRTMVQDVMANNNSAEASDETRVSINGGTATLVGLANTEGASPAYGANFKNTKTYNVDFIYTNGKVTDITVTEVTTTP